MSTFRTIADLGVPLVDADAHVNEPPELWQERVPAAMRDRAPRVIECDDGDCWCFEDGAQRPIGMIATAGLGVTQFRTKGVRYAEMRPGAYEPKARLADMDADGVHAQVLFPSVALEGATLYTTERDLQLACVRAYNEWLAEFCEAGDGRLGGLAVMPTTGVPDALTELDAAVELGHRGVLLSAYPNGTMSPEADDDRFWISVADRGIPAAIHLGGFVRARGTTEVPDAGTMEFLGVAGPAKAGARSIDIVCELLFSGLFERVPALRLVLAESGIGWIPSTLEQLDTMFLRYRWVSDAVERMRSMPSELFYRNVWASFITDRVGLENIERIPAGHVMWSTDYPHDTCEWPNSRATLEQQLRGLPLETARALVHDNAADLYGFAVA